MKDWERIREVRPDITDYVIHWVRPKTEDGKYIKPLAVLVEIIESGYLKPTFATRRSIYNNSTRPTVKGPHPAVCFTEQSLDNFIKSCKVLSSYNPYGIALHKRALYQYGGRPVIYDSEEILGTQVGPGEPGYETGKHIYKNGLPKDYQYLWMRYQPIPNQDGYVVDWTHEREWRCRAVIYHDAKYGNTPAEVIPLLLPAVHDFNKGKPVYYLPKILVKSSEDVDVVTEIVSELLPAWTKGCQNAYLKGYFDLLHKVKIIALNELEDMPEATELDWVIS